jgi:hypothetical protein
MTSLRPAALLLSALGLAACGGSQKSPDAAAAQAAAAASASTEAKPGATAVDAPAKPAEPNYEAESTGCKKDGDCTIFADCCSCRAVLASKPPPVPCESVCGESKCEVKGITIDNVVCDAGRCVIKKKR